MALTDTLNVLLTPLRLLLAPLNILLAPIYAHLSNAILLLALGSAAAYFLLPILPSILLKLLGKVARYLSGNFITRVLHLYDDSDIALGSDVLILPARTLATPACLLTGLFCQTSLLSHQLNGTTIPARPLWKAIGGRHPEEAGDPLDVGQVARALTKEVRGARDIFDSVRMLGQGSVVGGLEYLRIWELAVAIGTGSSLDDKSLISAQLTELGDMTRDLSDEIVHIDSTTVNAFSWLQWEFSDLVRALSAPESTRPSSEIISRKLHTLLLRLSEALDSIHALTTTSARHASQASAHGQGLYTHLSRTATGLKYERDRSPGWKRVYDKSAHFLVGGEPSKTELIDRDLSLTTSTISNIRSLSRSLEETRTKVKLFRDQIGLFEASMMGFHLGANEKAGLGPEEEVRILGAVVDELGRAVGSAKDRGARTGASLLEIDE
ncbi:hypothetical protein I316_03599 [Kwoniella heveanensis BCC8398]|uniref:Uncharacterized protein n=1 Tax=Kwoniella heveanensis BCC8398 TaxID=1296120 RepID=A0A1B9GU82_9TREE|nr:hypothetical protein I316_03599 [Kwoniella heveanensis BCC8398]